MELSELYEKETGNKAYYSTTSTSLVYTRKYV